MELIEGPIPENNFATMIRRSVPDDTQRDVWYSIIIADSSVTKTQSVTGEGGNALKVTEDTQTLEISYFTR